MNHDDWSEYKNLLLGFKTTTEKRLDCFDAKLDRLLEDVGSLKGKAVVWGGITAAIISIFVSHVGK